MPASPDSGVYMYVYVYVYVYVYGVGLSIIIILSNNKKRECSKRVVVTTQSREKEKGRERERILALYRCDQTLNFLTFEFCPAAQLFLTSVFDRGHGRARKVEEQLSSGEASGILLR